MLSKKVIYSGDVQGVGFRYRAMRLAQGFPVVGYVKNLPDGLVELVVQGDDDQVSQCIAAIHEEMRYYIRDAKESLVPLGGYTDFRIVH